jgi:GNAT superfamily N-acetyltransferase
MSTPVAFRQAGEADLHALAVNRWRLRVEEDGEPAGVAPADFHRHCETFLRQAMRGGRWGLWLAEAEGRIVANACVQVVPKVPRPGRFDDAIGYLTNVYAEPAWRGRGVGTALLRHVLEWARGRDLELLVVWPSERSRTLYARAGFTAGEVQELVLRAE